MEKSIEQKKNIIYNKFIQIENSLEEIGFLLINLPKDITSKKKSKISLKDLLEIEPKLDDLKQFYSKKLYKALNSSILNSINCLVSSCGYQSALDNIYISKSDNIDKTKDQDDILRYIRIKSTEDILRNTKGDRPISVSSALEDLSWNNEVKLDNAFLKYYFFMLNYINRKI